MTTANGLVRGLLLGFLGTAMAGLVGCSGVQIEATSGPAPVVNTPVSGAPIKGSVYGGQQPIVGATIQLYAAGTTGYGSAATALIPVADQVVYNGSANTGAMTGAGGSFQITGDYSCPSSTSQMYITSTGGDPTGVPPPSGSITAVSVSGSTATFTTATNTLLDGESVTLSGFTGAANTFLNGQVVTVLTDTATSFTANLTTTGTPSSATGTYTDTGSTVNNTSVTLLAALGSCGSLSSATNITINEVTTVAAVWALQQYIGVTPGSNLYSAPGINGAGTLSTPAFTIGSSGTTQGLQGIANAMGVASLLANTSLGKSPTTANSAGVSVEYWQVNLVADILSSCVNSVPGSSTNCATLFGDTAQLSGSAPADTAQAAYSIAANPLVGATTLTALVAPTAPFVPTPTTVNDFSIGYVIAPSTIAGKYLNNAYSLAVDEYGNLWAANNCHGTAGTCTTQTGYQYNTQFVTEFDPLGNVLYTTNQYNLGSLTSPNSKTLGGVSAYTTPFMLAIDPNNNVWASDTTDGIVFEIPGSTGAGVASLGNATTNLGLNTGTSSSPSGIAVDGTGNVWFAMQGATAPIGGFISAVTVSGGTATFTNGTFSSTKPAVGDTMVLSGFTGANNVLNGSFTVTASGSSTFAVAAPTGAVTQSGLADVNCMDTVSSVSGFAFAGSGFKGYGGIASPSSTGPLTGFLAGIVPNTAATQQMVVDLTPASSYVGAPYIWAHNEGAYTYGQINHLFSQSGTNTGSTSNTTAVQGQPTPLSQITDAEITSTSDYRTHLTDVTAVFTNTAVPLAYNGTSYTAYGVDGSWGGAVDGTNSVWYFNTTLDSANSGFAKYSLSKITPSYSTNSTYGALTGSVTNQVFTSATLVNEVNTLNTATHGEYIAVDGGNNVWMTASCPTATCFSTAAVGSWIEFNNSGTDVTAPYGLVGATGSSTYARKSDARYAIAIDLSGNVYSGSMATNGDTIFVLVGAAAPTVNPLSLALKNGQANPTATYGRVGTKP